MATPNPKKTEKSDSLNAYARYAGIAFQMLAIIGVGTFAGVQLDEYYENNSNLYTIILSLSSVIIAIVIVIKQIISDSKDN